MPDLIILHKPIMLVDLADKLRSIFVIKRRTYPNMEGKFTVNYHVYFERTFVIHYNENSEKIRRIATVTDADLNKAITRLCEKLSFTIVECGMYTISCNRVHSSVLMIQVINVNNKGIK